MSALRPTPLFCGHCRTALSGAVVNTADPVPCPGCQSPLLTWVFPAFFREGTAGRAAENVGSDEDASCFYHAAKKAVVPCGRCGRFLCSLCDINLGGDRHVCPGCVEAARQDAASGKPAQAAVLPAARRLLRTRLALLLATVPALAVWPSLLTAPAALFLAVRYWNEPRQGPVPRSRWCAVFAIFLALLELGAWTYFIFVANHRFHALFG